MSSNLRKLLPLVIVVALAAAVIAYLATTRSRPPVKPSEESRWTVDVEILQAQDLAPELTLLGEVTSHGLTLISSRINADVVATPKLAGDRVTHGEELLVLDPTDAQANLSQRQADVAELEASLAEERLRFRYDNEALARETNLVELSRKSLARQKQLVKNNVASQERLETAEIALEQQQLALTARSLTVDNHANRLAQLQARLTRARALRAVAEKDFAQTRLQAPFSGWITELHTAPGGRVRVGDRLLEILAEDSLEVAVQIPNSQVPALRDAMAQGVTLVAHANLFERQVPLRLSRLAARANPRTAGIDAFFAPVEPGSLTLGKSVSIHLRMPVLADVFALPASALYGDATVYQIVEGRLAPVIITRLGRYRTADGQERLIFRSGDLQAGATVVLTQLPNAVSGLLVEPRKVVENRGTAL